MDLLINILIDFNMFSILESIIFCLYFRKFGNCEKFSIEDILVIGFGNCIISQVIPPLIYQMIIILWMGLYLKLFKNKTLLNGIWLSFSIMGLFLIIEMCFAMFYENCFNFDFVEVNKIKLFLAIIPMKLFEILTILGGSKMKIWFSEIEKKK